MTWRRHTSRRRTRMSRRGNYAWLNGYNTMALSPAITGVGQTNTVCTLLLPTDWEGGGPSVGVKMERLVYWLVAQAMCVTSEPLYQFRAPYVLFKTDKNIGNNEIKLTQPPLHGPGWPVWALGNDLILRYGTTELPAGQGQGTGQSVTWQQTMQTPENVIDWKVNRRLTPDDSIRLCLSADSYSAYPTGYLSYWLVDVYSRMLLRMNAK